MSRKSTAGAMNVNYSYWELKEYFRCFDLIVIGSGIVGLSSAISFRERHKNASVLVLERGILPSGASTKNAGFACFGSAGELLDDLSKMPEQSVWDTVALRWKGLQLLRKRLGDTPIAYEGAGGFELFDDEDLFEQTALHIPELNRKMQAVTGLRKTYSEDRRKPALFKGVKGVFRNRHEGQLDTSLMMRGLLDLARRKGVLVLNGIAIRSIEDQSQTVELVSDHGIFTARKAVVATNGFATQLLEMKDVHPARAQVLVTKPIKNLRLKGAFHYQQGFYYFRNIDGRLLFGGGRNLDLKAETTTSTELNERIQGQLDKLLRNVILPGMKYEVEHRWAGIMGVGSEKKPIVSFVSKNVLAAVRMGGMGVAIGSMVGEMAAEKISQA